MSRRAIAAALFSMVLPALAHAHALAPALLELRELSDGTSVVRWKLPSVQPRGARIEPALPAGCRQFDQPLAQVEGEGIVQTLRVRCGEASWVGQAIGLHGLVGSDTDAVLRITLADSRIYTALLSADVPAFTIPPRASRTAVVREYVALGINHLLTGIDHVLFVLGLLMLVRGVRPLIATLTSFTLGHSVTLSLAILGLVAVPQAAAELAIAASILVLGAEIIAARGGAGSVLSRRPWVMAAAFGLLHGLGFAGALAAIGLPQEEVALSLAAFNAGLEVGQLGVVVVAMGAARIVQLLVGRARLPALLGRSLVRAPVVVGYAIGCAAAFWCFERLAPALRSLRL